MNSSAIETYIGNRLRCLQWWMGGESHEVSFLLLWGCVSCGELVHDVTGVLERLVLVLADVFCISAIDSVKKLFLVDPNTFVIVQGRLDVEVVG